ncbi:matrilin-3-like, partial [Saccostrea cucullata]|uniref:matrilin-3-like n=1 Tax=Saccostrea cuccullata TaxID=36930 RepID=UPI002ECFAE3C
MILTLIIFMNMMFISTVSPKGCSPKPIDFVFLLDESGSVGEANFILQNEFVAKFVEVFSNGSDLARVAVVTFATTVKIEFYLNTYLSNTKIIEKIRRINYSHPGLTMTQFALHSARTEILNVNHGMRPNALYVVIVMTDGKSMIRSRTIYEAKQLHNMDVIVFAIGIGTEIDKEELRGIASHPDYVFTVNDFHTLETIQNGIKNSVCK